MTTFKAFLKVLNKNKFIVILYTIILVFFGGFQMKTSESTMNFVATKPDVFIVNQDEEKGITSHLMTYIKQNCHVVPLENNERAKKDALFYRDVSFIIYIPKHYHDDFLNGKNPEIKVESTGDYEGSLANMMLNRYLKLANIYQQAYSTEEQLLSSLDETLENATQVNLTSHLDTDGLNRASLYYNFFSYSMLAGAIYVICLILSSFHDEKIKKRTVISSMNMKKRNRILLLSNSLFAFVLWFIYVLLSFVLCGKVMLSIQGVFYILNSFLFSFVCVTLAFLISNVIHNKNAINGIVNVVALGSSFLCGAFVPVNLLPKSVLSIAHILPTYWYIQSNELLKRIDTFDFLSLKPIYINMSVMILFSILFILLSNIISKRKQKLAE